MNFESYKRWRDQKVREHDPWRLDCMNPVKALDYLRPLANPDRSVQNIEPRELACEWARLAGFELGEPIVVSRGIRTLLAAVLEVLGPGWKRIWLPQDVYPVYWKIARHWPAVGFRTWPDLDLAKVLASDSADALLLPMPLTPTGRYLTGAEAHSLGAWLDQNERRRLLLDTVYQFCAPIPPAVAKVLEHPQTIALRSVSKSWISRQVLGVMEWTFGERVKVSRLAERPLGGELVELADLMARRPRLPADMGGEFAAEWQRLSPRLRAIDPEWKPPDTGYFSLLRGDTESLLEEHNLMAVPGSVFGSSETDWSVISCLHDLRLHAKDRG